MPFPSNGTSPLSGFSDKLMATGAALNPKIGAMVADREQKQLQQALIMGQLNQMQQQQARQQMVQSALANFKGDPQQLLGVLATIDSETFAPTYLKEMGEQVTTSPTGALANFSAPSAVSQPSGASPTMATGMPAQPEQPALQPLYKGGVPLTEGADKGYQWAQDSTGQRVQMPIPGGDVEKAKTEALAGVKSTISLVDQMIGNESLGIPEHPGLRAAVGGIDSKFPTFLDDTLDFEALLEQARGGAFLSAIQQLKGTGSLSDKEGDAATSAATRMRTAMSEDGFRKAAAEYRDIITTAFERMSGNTYPAKPPAAKSSAIKEGTTATNPKTGEKIIFKNGAWGPM